MLEDQEIQHPQEGCASQELPEKEVLVGLFELLIAVDRRINPQYYD